MMRPFDKPAPLENEIDLPITNRTIYITYAYIMTMDFGQDILHWKSSFFVSKTNRDPSCQLPGNYSKYNKIQSS